MAPSLPQGTKAKDWRKVGRGSSWLTQVISGNFKGDVRGNKQPRVHAALVLASF